VFISVKKVIFISGNLSMLEKLRLAFKVICSEISHGLRYFEIGITLSEE
jgi:hypothetical protein